MDTFTKILIGAAVIYLIYYYYQQYKKWKKIQATVTWPKEYSICPDYWTHEGNHICKNLNNLGKCPGGPTGLVQGGLVDMKSIAGGVKGQGDALDQAMLEAVPLNKKCRWARNCETPWEGIDKLCT